MHPAFSVIFFTTASGAGFGALAWLGLLALGGALPPRAATLVALALGVVLAAAGLLSSLGHLGQPRRAWRAFSQWRSSWLSREGVFATLTFLPALWLGWLALRSASFAPGARGALGFNYIGPASFDVATTSSVLVAGGLLALFALASVVCTAMIYASLKPIPAWRHPLVLPVYLAFALFSGGLLVLATVALSEGYFPAWSGPCVLAGAALLALLKWRAWHHVDHEHSPVSRNSALGLPHARSVQVFERPHTEANYLLKEMGYVLARKHAKKLRLLAVLLFALVPALLALPLWLLPQHGGAVLLTLALLSVLAGALVERWLFFAEARHLVTLYY
jgi:DMSO reductase anchor subunit